MAVSRRAYPQIFRGGFSVAVFSPRFFSGNWRARHYLPVIRQSFCERCRAAFLLFFVGLFSVVFDAPPSARPFTQPLNPSARNSARKKPAMKAGKIAVLDV